MDIHRLQVLRYCIPQSVSDSGLFYSHIAARFVLTLHLTVCERLIDKFQYRAEISQISRPNVIPFCQQGLIIVC